ncbi:MAG: hypothetical protein LQ339_007519 [Xanthoria mediterranea]|nr:MAG: hypothetical protein LQ339_007519 [Xanthoria mediterranea]
MPIAILAEVADKGIFSIPYVIPTLKLLPWLVLIFISKWYFGGTSNTSERLMKSKVVMITGGTSGIGAAVAQQLALRGAQIILLTQQPPSDPFLVDYIEDLRSATNNDLVHAEQVDLSSLHSIRLFATKWVDNAPPRRLDMIFLCANTMTPKFGLAHLTQDNIESNWGINFLATFHLLGILSPAIRAQPPDRDVRIVFGTCSGYLGGDINALKDTRSPLPARKEYGTSKLATMVFAQAFQKHLDGFKRPDKQPNNARVVIVDPGLTRTPGMRRWLSMGSLWGLLLYIIMWPLWWLTLKSPEMGAQSFLYAAMEADLGRGAGGRYIKACKERDFLRKEVTDEAVAKKLWEFSDKQIESLEKEGAVRRARAKKEDEKDIGAKQTGKTDGKGTSESKSSRTPGSRKSRK